MPDRVPLGELTTIGQLVGVVQMGASCFRGEGGGLLHLQLGDAPDVVVYLLLPLLDVVALLVEAEKALLLGVKVLALLSYALLSSHTLLLMHEGVRGVEAHPKGTGHVNQADDANHSGGAEVDEAISHDKHCT
eukprot:CAMPEP_0168619920 /NCGR_PEP_ID=MMETSP0449_2-20121227/6857_1 /TAXON_ID=1082188 /ORGANISM="Strombidium rassoulzadegani, Strain ras09" /LENGTH=132 /DNA_ID=CAMNT_0008660883 /DNA_START=158 /DNA_END=556 /DNA_ORIENTATION=-